MLRLWAEIVRIFRLDTTAPVYWRGHIVLLLILCEVFFLLSRNPNVQTYNGSDIWFALIYYVIPYGTLPVSLFLIVWIGRHVFNSLRGGGDFGAADFMAQGNIPLPPSGGGIIWLAFVRMILEGLVMGFVLFKLLPQIVFFLLNLVMDDIYIVSPLDANDNMFGLHTNFVQNMAIAFWAGAYEELLFRKWLFEFLQKIAPRYMKRTSFHLPAVFIVTSLIYAMSHFLYPVGDTLATYSLTYRFFFGILMCFIAYYRNLGAAAWTNAWYQLLYFAGA